MLLTGIDGVGQFGLDQFLQYAIATTAFSLLFTIKVFFGPTLVSISTAWAMYILVQYGDLEILAFFEFVLESFNKGSVNTTFLWVYSANYFIVAYWVHLHDFELSDLWSF